LAGGPFPLAVLDAPGVRGRHGVPEGVLAMLQEDLPVATEDIHAVGAVAIDGKLVVCAARREALREVPADVLRLSRTFSPPSSSPRSIPRAFNLLVGDFEPAPLRKERGRRRAVLTATTAVVACVLAVGLSRRAKRGTTPVTRPALQRPLCPLTLPPAAVLWPSKWNWTGCAWRPGP